MKLYKPIIKSLVKPQTAQAELKCVLYSIHIHSQAFSVPAKLRKIKKLLKCYTSFVKNSENYN